VSTKADILLPNHFSPTLSDSGGIINWKVRNQIFPFNRAKSETHSTWNNDRAKWSRRIVYDPFFPKQKQVYLPSPLRQGRALYWLFSPGTCEKIRINIEWKI